MDTVENTYQPKYKQYMIVPGNDDLSYVLDKFIRLDDNGMEGWTTMPDGEELWLNPDFAQDFEDTIDDGKFIGMEVS